MLHILLTILKIIGIILLSIIGIIFLICACLLFVPVRYSVKVKYKKNLDMCIKVTYLLRIISIKYCIKGKDKLVTFKIFGFDFKNFHRKNKKRNILNKDVNTDSKDIVEEIDNTEHIEHADEILKTTTKDNNNVNNNTNYNLKRESLLQKLKRKVKLIKNKIVYHIKKIYGKIKELFLNYKKAKEFINDEHVKKLFKLLKKEISGFIKYIGPRRIKGYVKFGFEDPSITGKILGGYYIFTKGRFRKLRVLPDFDNKILETDVFLNGRIRLYYLLYIALKIYMNKDFKHVLERRRKNG